MLTVNLAELPLEALSRAGELLKAYADCRSFLEEHSFVTVAYNSGERKPLLMMRDRNQQDIKAIYALDNQSVVRYDMCSDCHVMSPRSQGEMRKCERCGCLFCFAHITTAGVCEGCMFA